MLRNKPPKNKPASITIVEGATGPLPTPKPIPAPDLTPATIEIIE